MPPASATQQLAFGSLRQQQAKCASWEFAEVFPMLLQVWFDFAEVWPNLSGLDQISLTLVEFTKLLIHRWPSWTTFISLGPISSDVDQRSPMLSFDATFRCLWINVPSVERSLRELDQTWSPSINFDLIWPNLFKFGKSCVWNARSAWNVWRL